MDISESIFQKFSNWRKEKLQKEQESYTAYLEDNVAGVKLFFGVFAKQPSVLVRPAMGLGTVSSQVLELPEKVCFFKSKTLNRLVYLHKALVAGYVLANNLSYEGTTSSKKDRSLQVWALSFWMQNKIKQELPNYESFFSDLLNLPSSDISKNNQADKAFLGMIKGLEPIKLSCMRKDLMSEQQQVVHRCANIPEHRLSYYPLNILFLYTGLLSEATDKLNAMEQSDFNRNKNNFSSKEEIEGKNASSQDVKAIDLNKKKEEENPILHSFETLHTADEYRGGYRVSDGGDELASHEKALDELNLETVTRGGEAAQSVYRASIDNLFEILSSKKDKSLPFPYVEYPEWDYKKSIFKENYCRLYLSSNEERSSSAFWLNSVREKYGMKIPQWKNKIEAVVNKEVWKNRQWDGAEIDLESYATYHSDRLSGSAAETPLYMRKNKALNDTACLLLFDQSFSTDSWVNNQRVLDLELEALGLFGLLTQDSLAKVCVAGMWSETRKKCFFQIYKEFESSWESFFQQCSNIEPMGYTRLGPAIRHATKLLGEVDAKNRLLLLITDGKPTDYDRYEGTYGIEDVKKAILATSSYGIHCKVVAIDKKSSEHLAHTFGKTGYVLLNDPKNIFEAIWQIYLSAH